MNQPNTEFEDAWVQLSRVLASKATLKEICELFFLKGRCVGVDVGMRPLTPDTRLSPEDEAKLASVTIGEHFNHSHYGDVLEALKQTQ